MDIPIDNFWTSDTPITHKTIVQIPNNNSKIIELYTIILARGPALAISPLALNI